MRGTDLYHRTRKCQAGVVEPVYIENMDVGLCVGILFLAVLCAEIVRLPVTSSTNRWTAGPRKHGAAVGVLLLCVLELWCDMMWATNDNKRIAYFRFLRRHIWFLESGVRTTNIAFCSTNIFRKSHESALLDIWQFQSSGDENGLGYFTPSPAPLAIRVLIFSVLSFTCEKFTFYTCRNRMLLLVLLL